jgi:H+/gluconate symporter-like permease
MSDTLIVLHTAIAILAIVLLIVAVKVDPVISLVIGTLYLGVAAGLGFADTIGTFVQGFGDIMAEVGLLIGFGVLMGTLLTAMGALQKLVELLLRVLGPRRLPYAFSAALSSIFPAIYVDVQLVLASPLARSAASRMGRNGLAMMGGTLTNEHVEDAMHKGFNATGQILLITGIGGSLGAVIGETGLDKILGGFFSAEAGTPELVTIMFAWLIAAILHLAIGSISVAAITAAGILAPILGSIEVPTVVLGLAIGFGALFALQVNSNFFWMFETLLGLTTQGTLKALTLVTAMASVVSLILILALSLVV